MITFEEWWERIDVLGKEIDDLTKYPIATDIQRGMDVYIWRDYDTKKIRFSLVCNSNINHSSVELTLSYQQIYKICKIIEEG